MKKILGFVLILFVAACSSDDAAQDVIPGSELPELTAPQKQRMGDFSQAHVDSQGATSSHNKRPARQIARQFISLARKATASTELTQKGEEVAKQVSEAIASDECLLTAEWPEPDANSGSGSVSEPTPVMPFQLPGMGSASGQGETFNMEINVEIGNNKSTRCPISSLFQISMKGTTQTDQQLARGRFDIGFVNNFEVKEWSPLYTEMDVVGFGSRFNMEIYFNANQGGFSINGTGAGETNIVSKPSFEGVVGLKTSMNINASGSDQNNVQLNMQIVSDFQFTDFQAVGVIRGSLQGQQQDVNLVYYINGDVVTEQEYMEFFSGSFTTDSATEIQGEGDGLGMNFPIATQ